MSAEPKFVPKEGQIDFTHARFCPVINCVIEHEGKLLLVKRNKNMRLYPGLWNGISGFLDDKKTIEEKVEEELGEELAIKPEHIKEINIGPVLVQEASDYEKTWLVFPVHVIVDTDKYKLDSEASEAKWLTLSEARSKKLLPGFSEVLDTIFGAY